MNRTALKTSVFAILMTIATFAPQLPLPARLVVRTQLLRWPLSFAWQQTLICRLALATNWASDTHTCAP